MPADSFESLMNVLSDGLLHFCRVHRREEYVGFEVDEMDAQGALLGEERFEEFGDDNLRKGGGRREA